MQICRVPTLVWKNTEIRFDLLVLLVKGDRFGIKILSDHVLSMSDLRRQLALSDCNDLKLNMFAVCTYQLFVEYDLGASLVEQALALVRCWNLGFVQGEHEVNLGVCVVCSSFCTCLVLLIVEFRRVLEQNLLVKTDFFVERENLWLRNTIFCVLPLDVQD